MRIKQARISKGIIAFKEAYLKKFNLVEGSNRHEPIVLFGMYNPADFQYYLSHTDAMVVVWCGTDSLMLTMDRSKMLKSKYAIHIAKSNFISTDLDKYGIVHTVLPISWQLPDLQACPRGENIFHYGNSRRNNFYGESYLSAIQQRTGFKIIGAQINTYTKEQLIEIYRSCFIGLRLTKHDGVPNTVVELGMMGRRCIYNGDLPNAIPWKGVDDICESIIKEYNHRDADDTVLIEQAVKKYIDIGDGWLNYE